MIPFFTAVSAVLLLHTSGLDAATIPVLSLTTFNHSVPSSAPPITTSLSTIHAFPVLGTDVKLIFTASSPDVPKNDLITAIETGLIIIAHRIIDFGPNALINPETIRFQCNGVKVEVANLGAGSMTWVDLTATLWGILDFTTRNGYSGRSFTIGTDRDGFVGSGRFRLDVSSPTTLPAGSNPLSQIS